MNKNKLGFLLSLIFLVSACMSAPKTKPDFEDYVPAAFWGLTPPAYPVNTAKVCPNQQMPVEVRKGKSAEDWALAFFSLGIYWPHTVQVWCPATSVAQAK